MADKKLHGLTQQAEVLENVAIDALAVLVAVRDGMRYSRRLSDVIERLQRATDRKHGQYQKAN